MRLLWPVWVFISAGVLATAGLAVWRLYEDPSGHSFAVASVTEFVVASLCAGFALFLSGTLAMGEERMLGVQAWHMTVPVSFRTQWLLKFGLVLGASLLGTAPLVVIGNALAGPEFSADISSLLDPAMIWIAALTVVLGFWCASIVKGTSRALLWICPVIAIVFVGARVGAEISTIARSDRLLNWLPSVFPKPLLNLHGLFSGHFPMAMMVLPVLVMATLHSYHLFRIEVPEGSRLLLRGVVPLVLMALLGGFAFQTIREAYFHLLFPGR